MKIKKNGKVINLTESDLRRIVKKVIKEQDEAPVADATKQNKPETNKPIKPSFKKIKKAKTGIKLYFIYDIPNKKFLLIELSKNKEQ